MLTGLKTRLAIVYHKSLERLRTAASLVLLLEVIMCVIGIILMLHYRYLIPRCDNECVGQYDTCFETDNQCVMLHHYMNLSVPVSVCVMLGVYTLCCIAFLFGIFNHSAPLMVPVLIFKGTMLCCMPFICLWGLILISTKWSLFLASTFIFGVWFLLSLVLWKTYQKLEEATCIKRNASMAKIFAAAHQDTYHRPNPRFSTAPAAVFEPFEQEKGDDDDDDHPTHHRVHFSIGRFTIEKHNHEHGKSRLAGAATIHGHMSEHASLSIHDNEEEKVPTPILGKGMVRKTTVYEHPPIFEHNREDDSSNTSDEEEDTRRHGAMQTPSLAMPPRFYMSQVADDVQDPVPVAKTEPRKATRRHSFS